MLSFMLNLKVKATCEQEAIEKLTEIERVAHTDKGCITFSWFQQIEEPLKFTLLEQWQDQEVLDLHIKHITPIWESFTPCLDGEAVSTKLRKLVE